MAVHPAAAVPLGVSVIVRIMLLVSRRGLIGDQACGTSIGMLPVEMDLADGHGAGEEDRQRHDMNRPEMHQRIILISLLCMQTRTTLVPHRSIRNCIHRWYICA